jgi:hypothetical protein
MVSEDIRILKNTGGHDTMHIAGAKEVQRYGSNKSEDRQYTPRDSEAYGHLPK